jgi:hypothetical protein
LRQSNPIRHILDSIQRRNKAVRKPGSNLGVFVTFLGVGLLVALAIIPGLDMLAWHILKPEGFWQEIIVAGVELVTLVPRIFAAVMLFLALGKLGAEVA